MCCRMCCCIGLPWQINRIARSKQNASKSVIVDVLDAIDPMDESTFPIKFEEFSFNIFAAFLKTFKKTVTKRSRHSDDATTVVITTMNICLGVGSFSDACSALAFLFVECGIEKDATQNSKDLWRKISLYMQGACRTVAREHQALGLCMIEGKDLMPFPAYVKLASILAQSPDPEQVVAHLFLLLDWNTVSHAKNVCNAHLDWFGILMVHCLYMLDPARKIKMG